MSPGDRTVQVPVSLIEGMPHENTCDTQDWRYGDYYGEDLTRTCDCYRAKFAALLSRPIQPAEPPRMTTDEDVAEAQALLDQVVRESGIESMTPGTRLRADRLVNRDEWEWDGHNLRRLRDGLLQGPEDIDPSTIRDVTPPKETP